MKQIHSLKPNVTREQALKLFTGGLSGHAANVVRGRVRSIADLYIPYRFFQVKVRSGGKEESHIFALEAVWGVLDLYEFPSVPEQADLLTLETRNVLPAALDTAQAEKELIAKVRRLIFTRGFFQLRDLQIEAAPISVEIFIPYCVCFRGTGGLASLSVLDAVRRRMEGAKVRHLIEGWLRSSGTGSRTSPPESSVLS